MARSDSQLPKVLTETEYFVLSALVPTPLYGYRIVKEIEDRTRGDVKLSLASLYDALHRLQEVGLIEEFGQEVVDGRARKTYRLTAVGESALTRNSASYVCRSRKSR